MGTGEWHDVEELYTIVEGHTDTSDLDLIINFDWGDSEINDVMQPLVDIAKSYKEGVESGLKQSIFELADRDRALQELTLGLHGNVASMQLVQNIAIRKDADDVYLIGANVAHFYPLCIEFGRGHVEPVEKEWLHYYTQSGVEIFSKYSRPYEAHPFVEPAFEDIVSNAEEIVMRCIGDATN